MNDSDRCSSTNNLNCHIVIDIDKLEKDRIKLIKDIKKLQKRKENDPYIKIAMWLMILGIILIVSSVV